MKYAVFKQDDAGVLSFAGTSRSLGEGPNEVAYIVNGHGLQAGDVIHFIDGGWRRVETIDPATERIRPLDVTSSTLSPVVGDDTIRYGDGPWSPAMATRLLTSMVEVECPGNGGRRRKS